MISNLDKSKPARKPGRKPGRKPAQRSTNNIFALNRLSTAQQSAYRRQEVDPVVDKLRSMLDQSGLTDSDAAIKAGLAPSTVIKIRLGVTRQPRHRTVFQIAEACGFTYIFVPLSPFKGQGSSKGKGK